MYLYIDMLIKIISEEHVQLTVVNLQQWVFLYDHWYGSVRKILIMCEIKASKLAISTNMLL